MPIGATDAPHRDLQAVRESPWLVRSGVASKALRNSGAETTFGALRPNSGRFQLPYLWAERCHGLRPLLPGEPHAHHNHVTLRVEAVAQHVRARAVRDEEVVKLAELVWPAQGGKLAKPQSALDDRRRSPRSCHRALVHQELPKTLDITQRLGNPRQPRQGTSSPLATRLSHTSASSPLTDSPVTT